MKFGRGGAEGLLFGIDCWTVAWNESSINKLGLEEFLENVPSSVMFGPFETAAATAAEATL